jgi:type I restriction enzyme S subunit
VYAINDQLHHLIGKAHGGVGLRHVARGAVESLRIPLPALAEQKRIAAILNRQLAMAQQSLKAAEAQRFLASRLYRDHLIASFGDAAVATAVTYPLSDVAQLLPSKSISTYGEAAVEAVTTACLTEAGFDRRGTKVARMAINDVPHCVLNAGEVLVARSNTPELVGRAAMFPGADRPIVASDLTIRIKAREKLLPAFLAGYLSYLYVSKYWIERSGGASGSMKKITRTQIEALPIPVPNLEEQERIVHRTREINDAVSHALSAIDHCLGAISALSSALLRRAFSGSI